MSTSRRVQELVSSAELFARCDDWDGAIGKLAEARRVAVGEDKAGLDEMLAVGYAQIGIARANEAMSDHGPEMRKGKEWLAKYDGPTAPWYLKLRNIFKFPVYWPNPQHKCGGCGDVGYSAYDWKGRNICWGCKRRLESWAKRTPTVKVVRRINAAVRDLRRAQSLSPRNANIRQQCSEVESLWEDVCEKRSVFGFVVRRVVATVVSLVLGLWMVWLAIVMGLFSKPN